MRCPNCNNEIPEGKRFCGHCGQRLVQVPAPEGFDEDAPTQLIVDELPQPPPQPARPVGVRPKPQTPTPPPSASPHPTAPPPKRRAPGRVWRLIGAMVVVAILVILVVARRFNAGALEGTWTGTGRQTVQQDGEYPEFEFTWVLHHSSGSETFSGKIEMHYSSSGVFWYEIYDASFDGVNFRFRGFEDAYFWGTAEGERVQGYAGWEC